MVLDASAAIAILLQEPDAQILSDKIEGDAALYFCGKLAGNSVSAEWEAWRSRGSNG